MLFSKKKIIIVAAAAALGSAAIYFFQSGGEKTEYITARVVRGVLSQTVSETGTVKAVDEINLSFYSAGKVGRVAVKVGEEVKKDAIISELDLSGLKIKESESQASLAVAQANLSKIMAGATSVDIAVAAANVSQAEMAYYSAVNELDRIKASVAESISQAEKKLSDLRLKTSADVTAYEQAVETAKISLANTTASYSQAVLNSKNSAITTMEDKLTSADIALDAIDRILNDEDAKNFLSVKNIAYLNYTKTALTDARGLLAAGNSAAASAKAGLDGDLIESAFQASLAAIDKTLFALKNCFSVLENSITSSSFTQTELDAFKTTISSQTTTMSAGLTAVQTAQQNLNSAGLSYDTNVAAAKNALAQAEANLSDAIIAAGNSLNTAKTSGERETITAQGRVNSAYEAWQVAKAQLAKIKSPTRSEDVSLAEAQHRQAQAALEAVRKQIEDSLIKSPIDGTITKINYDVGEQAMAGQTAVSVLAKNNFEIEVDISETDISKIKITDQAEITLDAFGEDKKFNGRVSSVEPAATVIQDVIYYKTKIQFSDLAENGEKQGIKPGMTANVIIFTDKKENVLYVPARAVIEKNGDGKFVRILINGRAEEVSVTTGLRGDGGFIEIVSGLEEGAEIITSSKTKN